MDIETGNLKISYGSKAHRKASYQTVLTLAYQSFGVVYRDLSTSPLYVYKSTFSGKLSHHENDDEILGVLSFVFWTFTLIPLFKYIFFVLTADDNGEGGTFALYSLLCRHVNLSLLPNQQPSDEQLSTYKVDRPRETALSWAIRSFLEKHHGFRIGLLVVVLLGTCMVIGDGVLTPTISVLSAVSGMKVKIDLHENCIVAIACIILVGLFALQHCGTHKVGFMFAPIVIAWLICIGAVGVYNIIHWNPKIFRALSPYYMYKLLKKMKAKGWESLGGIALCITGAEAMFADLGHFSQSSIKIAFTGLVYPCLILAYMGEAAFLSKHMGDIGKSFYMSIPEAVFWPIFIVATLAAVVGSQAVISATFSIINQCSALSCFPRVKVVHTSKQIYGQIYIPEINWILMCLCLAVTIGFKDTNMIGHAYGLAVTTVMFVTTCLMFLVIIMVWQKSIYAAVSFLVIFGSVELLYISASLIKVPEGGWVPLVLSLIFMAIMYTWHYGSSKKYEFDLQNKVSMERILNLGPSLGMVRVPGIGLIYTELVTGVPAIFGHFVTNLPAFHQVLVFVCVKSVQVPYVPIQERYLIGRIGPKEYRMFRCIFSVSNSYNISAIFHHQISGSKHSAVVCTMDSSDGHSTVHVSSARQPIRACRSFRLRSESLNSVRLRRIFEAFDRNGDGLITTGELDQALLNLGLPIALSDLQSTVGPFVKTGRAGLDFEDFSALHRSLGDQILGADALLEGSGTAEEEEEEDLKEAFSVFDEDGDGYISAAELYGVIRRLGLPGAGDVGSCERMIFPVDENHDGRVDFVEFKHMMRTVTVRGS